MRTNTRMRCGLAAASFIGLALGGQLPAQAEETNTGDSSEASFTESEHVALDEADVAQTLGDATEPDTQIEEQAVDSYLADSPSEGSYLTSEDLEVGTIEVADGLTATVVAPEVGIDVSAIDIVADAGDQEVSAGAAFTATDDQPVTAGPGMGSWPSWTDTASFVVELKVYLNGNWIGTANFQTQRRKYQDDGDPNKSLWQVARRARATPDELEVTGPDLNNYVKKLWASSQLTDGALGNAQQWRQDLTNPDEGFTNCEDGLEVSAGPFTFVVGKCEDYDVWQGAIGHHRFDYDQGTYAGGGQKAVAYVSGIQMDQNAFPNMTWYEFVTIRRGHWSGSNEYKCASEEKGYEYSTQTLTCTWG